MPLVSAFVQIGSLMMTQGKLRTANIPFRTETSSRLTAALMTPITDDLILAMHTNNAKTLEQHKNYFSTPPHCRVGYCWAQTTSLIIGSEEVPSKNSNSFASYHTKTYSCVPSPWDCTYWVERTVFLKTGFQKIAPKQGTQTKNRANVRNPDTKYDTHGLYSGIIGPRSNSDYPNLPPHTNCRKHHMNLL